MSRFLTLFFVFILFSFVQAQDGRWAVGPHAVVSFPQSELKTISKTGEGLGVKVLYRLYNTDILQPRLDIVYISYGERRYSDYNYGATLTTRNESFQFTAGPQINQKKGRFTLYLAPMGGLYIYRTVDSNPELYYYTGYAVSRTRASSTKFGYTITAGTLVDIGLGPHIDISFKYQKIPGAVKTENDGQTFETDAEDINITIGVVFFLSED